LSKEITVPVRTDDKNVTIYRQIFAIAAAHVQTDGARFEAFQKSFNDWPWLGYISAYSCCYLLPLTYCLNLLYTVSTKNVKQFAHRLCGRALLRRPHLSVVQTWQYFDEEAVDLALFGIWSGCGAGTLVVSPPRAMCILKCVMARAQTQQQMIAVHSFVQSEANIQRNKELLLSWKIFLIAFKSGSDMINLYLCNTITSNDEDSDGDVSKDVSSINTIIIYYCSSREGHCTNNKKRAMKRILGRPNDNRTIEWNKRKTK
jgi:hypothetical protein